MNMYLASQAHNMYENRWRHKEDKFYAKMVKRIARKMDFNVRCMHNSMIMEVAIKYQFQRDILQSICDEYIRIGYEAIVQDIKDSDSVRVKICW